MSLLNHPRPQYESVAAAFGKRLEITAPAKVNLRLKIEGRREDGYHFLSMINAHLGLHDQISMVPRAEPGISISASGDFDNKHKAEMADPAKNIAARAAQEVLKAFDLQCGLNIELNKNIPLGAGLGGGSSDAAAVIRALTYAFGPIINKRISGAVQTLEQQLTLIGVGLGADVPYLLQGGLARVSGIGEKIDRFDGRFLIGERCVLLFPGFSSSTSEVYGNLRTQHPSLSSQRDFKGEQFAEMLRINTACPEYEPTPSRTVKAALRRQLWAIIDNDLEQIVCQQHPIISEVLTALRAHKDFVAGMSGSGSALYVLPRTIGYLDSESATAALAEIVQRFNLRQVSTYLLPDFIEYSPKN